MRVCLPAIIRVKQFLLPCLERYIRCLGSSKTRRSPRARRGADADRKGARRRGTERSHRPIAEGGGRGGAQAARRRLRGINEVALLCPAVGVLEIDSAIVISLVMTLIMSNDDNDTHDDNSDNDGDGDDDWHQ